MSNPETDLTNRILLDMGRDPSVRLFRNVVAVGWHGRVVEHSRDRMVILNPFPIHAGLHKGSADIIGVKSVAINGGHIGTFVSMEVKTPGARTSPAHLAEQDNWRAVILGMGGIAGYVSSEEDARKLLKGGL